MKKIAILTVFLFAFFPLIAAAQQYDPDYNPPGNNEAAPPAYDESQPDQTYEDTAEAPRGYYAQGDEEPDYDYEPGDMNFQIAGSGSSDESFDSNSFSAQGTLGFFMSEYLELFLRQGVTWFDSDRTDSIWAADTRAGLDIVFNLDRLKPFIGGSIGYIYGDDDYVDDNWFGGGEAGLRFFATDTAYFFGMMEYQTLIDNSNDDRVFDDERWVYTVGVGFKF